MRFIAGADHGPLQMAVAYSLHADPASCASPPTLCAASGIMTGEAGKAAGGAVVWRQGVLLQLGHRGQRGCHQVCPEMGARQRCSNYGVAAHPCSDVLSTLAALPRIMSASCRDLHDMIAEHSRPRLVRETWGRPESASHSSAAAGVDPYDKTAEAASELVSFSASFHGRTLGALVLTYKVNARHPSSGSLLSALSDRHGDGRLGDVSKGPPIEASDVHRAEAQGVPTRPCHALQCCRSSTRRPLCR